MGEHCLKNLPPSLSNTGLLNVTSKFPVSVNPISTLPLIQALAKGIPIATLALIVAGLISIEAEQFIFIYIVALIALSKIFTLIQLTSISVKAPVSCKPIDILSILGTLRFQSIDKFPNTGQQLNGPPEMFPITEGITTFPGIA